MTKSPCQIGFLSILERPDGILGAYLILNQAARPLEFHCTMPVRANRAQEILYGVSLQPYLCGELIAGALLARAQIRPNWIATDYPHVLAARPLTPCPLAWVRDAAEDCQALTQERSILAGAVWSDFPLGPFRAGTVPQMADDRTEIEAHYRAHVEGMDLLEPFCRIRQAIEEAGPAAQEMARAA